MDKYICLICGNVYDPATGNPSAGVEPGTPFERLPEDCCCSFCGAPKDHFEKLN